MLSSKMLREKPIPRDIYALKILVCPCEIARVQSCCHFVKSWPFSFISFNVFIYNFHDTLGDFMVKQIDRKISLSNTQLKEQYCKIPNINPRLTYIFKHILRGLYSGGLILGEGLTFRILRYL